MKFEFIHEEYGGRIYDILCECCGALDGNRRNFIFTHDWEGCREYRFQGVLGFGGKFRNEPDLWFVSCYSEDATPERQAIIDLANEKLAKLRDEYMTIG